MIHNAARILTQHIPIDVRINISMHHCVSITTVFCPMHESMHHTLILMHIPCTITLYSIAAPACAVATAGLP